MKNKIFILVLLTLPFGLKVVAQGVFSSGFESWTSGSPNEWVGSQTNLEPDSIIQYSLSTHSGTNSCRLVNKQTTVKKFSTKAFTVEAGASYNVSYWIRGRGYITNVALFTGTNSAIPGLNEMFNSGEWVLRSANFVAPVSTTEAELVFSIKMTYATYDDVQIDDVNIVQISQLLDINNIAAKICNNGSLFNGVFEVPKGSGLQTIYENSIWIGGIDETSQLHLAAQTYSSQGTDFSFGPVANDYSNPDYKLKYNRVWKINKSEIDYHSSHYNDGDYDMPSSITDWPGNGNVSNGEMLVLAPYFDANTNNTYDPENGDYPLIRGDQAIFFLFNDDNAVHSTGGLKFGIEVHGLAYSFDNPDDSALNQTIFVNYNIFNRSANNYHGVYFGSFTDMDLGNGMDDFVGCDSLLNMSYTYNANNSDDQYGIPAPAQGSVFLNHPISRYIYYNNSGVNTTGPTSPQGFYNFLTGFWNDGTPMTYGGDGYGGSIVSSYMFSGYPESSLGWTEISSGNAAGDRRGVMAVGPFSFDNNTLICVDLAFPFARDYEGTNITSLVLLRTRTAAIQTFYNTQAYECVMPNVGINLNTEQPNNILVIPNPSNGIFKIVIDDLKANQKIQVFSVLGKMVYSGVITSNETQINLFKNKGLFIYLITDENGAITGSGKIMIE